MGKPTGFLEYERQPMPSRAPMVRLNDFYEIYTSADEHTLKEQGARCMDCGVPFCQSDTGCPIDNLIPEWNDLVYHGRWREAYERMSLTNNFPEWTGRICPAPCESACVLGISEPPVTIKSIECAIAERAFAEGWVVPIIPEKRTGKKVAIVGSGPAGLAAADQLNKAGHSVTVFERDDRIGGLLMYGVPNMKLDKGNVTRRIKVLEQSGIEFRPNVNVGRDVTGEELKQDFDAILLACGALKARDLDMPGRDLAGVHLAMPYLTQTTKALLGADQAPHVHAGLEPIDARDKHVIVIGGGDTGADCIGTALRQGCKSLLNITRREREPDFRDDDHPWPGPTGTYFLDYSHAEGEARFGRDPREYGVLPLEFVGEPGNSGTGTSVPVSSDKNRVRAVRIERLEWEKNDGEPGGPGKRKMIRTGKVEDLPADLVLIAVGFVGHDTPQIVQQLGITEQHGVIAAPYATFATDVPGVFAAGDIRRGASLIVWAINEGRGAANAIDQYLKTRVD